jgi:hypothetical protein
MTAHSRTPRTPAPLTACFSSTRGTRPLRCARRHCPISCSYTVIRARGQVKAWLAQALYQRNETADMLDDPTTTNSGLSKGIPRVCSARRKRRYTPEAEQVCLVYLSTAIPILRGQWKAVRMLLLRLCSCRCHAALVLPLPRSIYCLVLPLYASS